MRSIEFLYDLVYSNIGMCLQEHFKAHSVLFQEKNRYFFGKGTVEVIKWLAQR